MLRRQQPARQTTRHLPASMKAKQHPRISETAGRARSIIAMSAELNCSAIFPNNRGEIA
jgi:hypothetical protein